MGISFVSTYKFSYQTILQVVNIFLRNDQAIFRKIGTSLARFGYLLGLKKLLNYNLLLIIITTK